MKRKLVSIVIPTYNEGAGLKHFYGSLVQALPERFNYELVFVNDGSKDNTAAVIRELHKTDPRVVLVYLSRNFGKEIALTAGIGHAKGDALICIDADGQYPVEKIDAFLKSWEQGHQIVIGIRSRNEKEGFIKRYGSKVFYRVLSTFAGTTLIPRSTDYRLIDREVRDAFVELHETNRITRGLIDWLGFEPAYITFAAKARQHGEASYSVRKLINLAVTSFVSLSFTPLFLFGYVGFATTAVSALAAIFIFIEQFALDDPMGLKITNSGLLALLIVFLVGVVLTAQGLMALYISHIYSESKRRPLFIINKSRSIL